VLEGKVFEIKLHGSRIKEDDGARRQAGGPRNEAPVEVEGRGVRVVEALSNGAARAIRREYQSLRRFAS